MEKFEMIPEKIVSAALSYPDSGEIFVGQTHADALIEFEERYPTCVKLPYFIEGFITNKDRFVDREEAAEIAKQSHQLEHLDGRRKPNAERYLDSDDIEELRKRDDD
jgi:hypothetical protein